MTLNNSAWLAPLACFLWLAPAQTAAAPVRVEAERQRFAKASAVAKARRANPARVPPVMLDPIAPADLAKGLAPVAKMGKPLQIGIGRPGELLKTAASMSQRMAWDGLAGGRSVGSVSVPREWRASPRPAR